MLKYFYEAKPLINIMKRKHRIFWTILAVLAGASIIFMSLAPMFYY